MAKILKILLFTLVIATPAGCWLSGAESVAESPLFILDLDPRISIADTASTKYLEWLSNFFSEDEYFNLVLVSEDSDPDSDGRNNGFEFLANLNPTDINDRLQVSFTGDLNHFLSYRPLKEGVNYLIQYSFDLETWMMVDQSLYEKLGETVQVDLRELSGNAFYRLLLLEPNP